MINDSSLFFSWWKFRLKMVSGKRVNIFHQEKIRRGLDLLRVYSSNFCNNTSRFFFSTGNREIIPRLSRGNWIRNLLKTVHLRISTREIGISQGVSHGISGELFSSYVFHGFLRYCSRSFTREFSRSFFQCSFRDFNQSFSWYLTGSLSWGFFHSSSLGVSPVFLRGSLWTSLWVSKWFFHVCFSEFLDFFQSSVPDFFMTCLPIFPGFQSSSQFFHEVSCWILSGYHLDFSSGWFLDFLTELSLESHGIKF